MKITINFKETECKAINEAVTEAYNDFGLEPKTDDLFNKEYVRKNKAGMLSVCNESFELDLNDEFVIWFTKKASKLAKFIVPIIGFVQGFIEEIEEKWFRDDDDEIDDEESEEEPNNYEQTFRC